VVGHANTARLIPLYAVGVFLAFALCQAGLSVHWWRRRGARWRRSILFNALGGALSALVFVIAAVTKFADGAWVALVAAGLIVCAALYIRRHYRDVRRAIALRPPAAAPTGPEGGEIPDLVRHLAVVPVWSLDLASMRALAYSASLRQPVLALHIAPDAGEADRFLAAWRRWGDQVPVEVVVSPYRALVAPLVHYLEALHGQRPDLTLTVILPELVVRRLLQRLLHGDVARRLRRALRPLPNVVVTTVPLHLPSGSRERDP
jgi:hypothetical protein